MENTRALMRGLITKESAQLTYGELAQSYKDGLNPIYLATAFDRLYLLIHKIGKKFISLSEHDLASYSLQKLDTCLKMYDETYATNFTSYFSLSLHRFLDQVYNTKAKKQERREMCEPDYVFNDLEHIDRDQQLFEFTHDLQKLNLTVSQYVLISLLMQGKPKKHIAKDFNISKVTLYKKINKLKQMFTLCC